MYYITLETLNKLPQEDQKIIEDEGFTMEEMDKMDPKEKAALMGEDSEGDKGMEGMMEPRDEIDGGKMDDSTIPPKSLKYGDEAEYQDNVDEEGKMGELPESKKNAIDSFEEANRRGNALIKAMDKPMLKKKKEPDITQEELDQK